MGAPTLTPPPQQAADDACDVGKVDEARPRSGQRAGVVAAEGAESPEVERSS
jgi:hypothetical protein